MSALRDLAPEGQNSDVDIIAVHGIDPKHSSGQSLARNTWINPVGSNGKLWLTDYLPTSLPDARILLYEYNSSVFSGKHKPFWDAGNEFLDYLLEKRKGDLRRPLILVAHSLGGLLVKQALANAYDNGQYADIRDSVKGLVFFGTPHGGGKLKDARVNLGFTAASIAQSLGFGSNDPVVEALRQGSLFGDFLRETFRRQLKSYNIVSFWEMKGTIVTEESATFGLPGNHEKVIGLDASHKDICRFNLDTEADRDVYEVVKKNMYWVYEEALKEAAPRQKMKVPEKVPEIWIADLPHQQPNSNMDEPSSFLIRVKDSTEQILSLVLENDLLRRTLSKAYLLRKWNTLGWDELFTNLAFERQLPEPMRKFLKTYSRYISARALEKGEEFHDSGNVDWPDSLIGFRERPFRESVYTRRYQKERMKRDLLTSGRILEDIVAEDDPELFDATFTHQKDTENRDLLPSERILENIMAENGPELFDATFTHLDFTILKSTHAFRQFIICLRDAAFPTFVSEARQYLLKVHSALGAEEQQILSFLNELQWSSAHHGKSPSFKIQRFEGFSLLDTLKLAVEKSTHSRWNWWPLCSPPMFTVSGPEKLRHGAIISWTCGCGSHLREAISVVHANKLRQLAQQYSVESTDPGAIALSSLLSPRTKTSGSTAGSSSSASPPKGLSLPAETSGSTAPPSASQSTGRSPNQIGDDPHDSDSAAPSDTDEVALTMDDTSLAFVSLFVRSSSRYLLATIDTRGTNALGFFQNLVAKYTQQRGILRCIFSVFVYSHCDFVKIEKYGTYLFTPGLDFSYPTETDAEYNEYHFNPRGMTRPPITVHQFNQLFYDCYDENTLKHFLHSFWPLSNCRVVNHLSEELLDYMPKRDREVRPEAQVTRVENFWGIVAREERSAFRVLIYMLMSLVPSTWFIFAWLFSWGHSEDLQGATVPITISLAALSMVWAVVYSGT